MNVERMMSLAWVLRHELTSSSVISELSALESHLQGAINSPSENTQRAVETDLKRLTALLQGAPTNTLSPGLRADLHDLRGGDSRADSLVGVGLLERISQAMS